MLSLSLAVLTPLPVDTDSLHGEETPLALSALRAKTVAFVLPYIHAYTLQVLLC